MEETAMVASVGSAAGPHISYSFTDKDKNNDGAVSFAEYMAPVPAEVTAITPADPSKSASMEDIFKAYDANGDGSVSAAELHRTVDVGGPSGQNAAGAGTGVTDAILSYLDAQGGAASLVRALL
jgi:Ca2+-binding EF-hand superfamily protein